jgi:transposase
MKLNSSDDKIIDNFDLETAQLIDPEKNIYGKRIDKPNSIKYFYLSESLQKKQLEAKARTVLKKLQEAKEIQEVIVKKKSYLRSSESIMS